MKKLFTLLILLTFLAGASWGQLSSQYGFSTSTTTFTEITGGTLLASGTFDDNVYNANNIGFTFNYRGGNFTQFSVNANGWLCMGATAVSSYTPISSGTSNEVISALGRDLNNNLAGTSTLRYEVVGFAPNRTMVLQWLHVGKYVSGGGAEDYNFQIRLNETSNTIDFVYGTFGVDATSTTVQVGLKGASNADFNNRSTTTSWASTIAGTLNSSSCTLSNTVFPASGQKYTYSPPPPCVAPLAQPTVLLLTPALNSVAGTFTAAVGSEDYLVVRSLSNSLSANPVNGTRYSVGTALGGGVVDYYGTGTSFTSGGLAPTTAYYYFVFSANDATCSAGPLYLTSGPLTNNTTTLSPGSVTSTGAGGLWSATTSWAGGIVPTATDNVTIVSGATVTVDAATNVCYSLTIDNGGNVNVATGTAFKLTVNNNLTNNGTLDLYISGTVYCELAFAGAYNSAFSGTGATSDLGILTINKGTGTITTSSPVLDILPDNLTIKGSASTSTTVGAFLNSATFNGILKFSGTYTLTNAVFQTTGYSIPTTGGFWLNNPNFTVAGLGGSPTMSGLFRVSNGIFNIGTSTGNSMGFSTGSKVYVEGGIINATGRFGVGSSTNIITYSQSGGAITVCTVGNTSTTLASFDLGTSIASAISLTGGSVALQLASTAASGPRDYRAPIGPIYPNFTGTTLYLGNALSGVAKTFRLIGSVMPMVLSTASANHNAAITGSVYYFGSLTIPTGCDLNLSGFGFWLFGATCVNDGTITATTALSRFDFANGLLGSVTQQDYSGTGTFGAGATNALSLGINNGQNVIFNSPVSALRVNLFQGLCKNAGFITIGNGASACFVQIGVAGATAPGGNFDVSPLYNLGTGTHTVVYEPETTPRVTGFEIPPARGITSISMNNVNGVTVTGGDITLGVAGILTLTSGLIHTSGGNHLILGNPGAAVVGGSATTYVDGPLSRTFAASRITTGSYTTSTLFPVGKGVLYLPVWVDPNTNAGGTVVVKSEAFLTNPGSAGGGVTGLSVNRWESVVTSGAANLTDSYLQIGDPSIVTGKQILQAAAGNGAYGGHACGEQEGVHRFVLPMHEC